MQTTDNGDQVAYVPPSHQPPLAPRPRDAALNLCLWQVEFDVRCKELSNRLGVSRQTLRLWRMGASKPGREFAIKIEQITGGRVPVESWGR